MGYFETIILGVVEGITEFLPISSTGHLILSQVFLGIERSEFLKSFTIIIQLGAILSVVILYWRALFIERIIWKKIIVAFLPTAAIGFVLYRLIKTYLLGSDSIVVLMLFLGGIALIVFELLRGKDKKEGGGINSITYKQAFFVGLTQSLAVVPGVSRSAATIIGGLALGISRKAIVQFSFLLAVPTMAAATGLDLIKSGFSFSAHEFLFLGVGFIASFLIAMITIRLLLKFIEKHTFIAFGVYRIIIAVLFLVFVMN